MRDTSHSLLERDAQRLAVLFESARAQSRVSGIGVVWHTTADGFRFEGLPDGVLPKNWLTVGVSTTSAMAIQLGPEPIIGPQSVDLVYQRQIWRVSTDGLRPFTAQASGQP